MGERPSVSVVIVNLDGAEHLPDCLDSLRDQTYPRELVDVIVVDNGSVDGSLELLDRRYPWVKVLPQGRNTGFAPAVNTGVQAAAGACVALVNNDMRVDPNWLAALVEVYDPDEGVVCVAGQILSWDAERVDFVEGSLNFYGMGHQVAFGRRREDVDVPDGQEVLFACGGSMLVDRRVFLDAGGFDDGFFAYFEDIDFGWRLNLLGYRVRLAGRALAYHRLHGTSSRFPEHQRLFLYERNALRLIAKNYDDESLRRALAPALLLTAKRAMVRTGLDRAPYWIGGDRLPTEEVPRTALAHLHAMVELVDDLDDVLARREVVQRARRRSDAEITRLFVRPMQPVPEEPGFVDAQRRLVAWFGLDSLFSERRAARVAVCADADGGRAAAMASALDDIAAVIATGDSPLVARAADVVLVDGVRPGSFLDLLPLPGIAIVDLPAPGAAVDPAILAAADAVEGERGGRRRRAGARR